MHQINVATSCIVQQTTCRLDSIAQCIAIVDYSKEFINVYTSTSMLGDFDRQQLTARYCYRIFPVHSNHK